MSNETYLETMYKQHYNMVHQLVSRILYDALQTSADADDLAQEVFILAAKKIDELRDHPNPVGWIIKVAQYTCSNHVRMQWRHGLQFVKITENQASPSDDYAASNICISLEQTLSAEDYALLHAYCIEKRPAQEICRAFQLSSAALRVRIYRLRKILTMTFILLVTLTLDQYI